MRHSLLRFLLLASPVAFTAMLTGCPQIPPPNNGGNGGNGGGDEEPARFKAPTRSSAIALTADDRFAVVVNRETDSVAVIEVRDANGGDVANKLAEIAVGDEPRFVALSPDDETAYVTNTASGTVSVIALTGNDAFTVTREIAVGSEPRGCAVTPNGTRLIVANHTSRSVSVIDTASGNVVATVAVRGFPQSVAITNDDDDDDTDETLFVTEFYAELISGGPGEAFDTGKQAFVAAIELSNLGAGATRIALSPLSDAGFTADRSPFCSAINGAAVNNTFCPDTAVTDATDPAVADVIQGAYPNQLHAIVIRGNRAWVPNTGAGPAPPIKFNVNVQALVHVLDVDALAELTNEHVNLNEQIKLETQPDASVANTVLDRLFGADTVAVDADEAGGNFLFVSRGGNFVLRATLDGTGILSIGAPGNVVRFQTGNTPVGVVMSADGKRAYTSNEVGLSVTAMDLENNTVLARDIPSAEPPVPGTFEHGVLVGKLAFFTSLGTPDNGLFEQELRDIVPLSFRGKASDNGWSSCTSCHPDGLADGVTWIFPTGPRQTIPLDAFFAKDTPLDQRISNWNAVRGGITDFNNNSRNVQGGVGFAGNPPNPEIYNHGITQGASDALDAQSLWVQTVRAPILPAATDASAAQRGRDLFSANCASCHGGAKWTKSQVIYADNPAFDRDPLAAANPGTPRDPGVVNAGPQIVSYTVGADSIKFIEPIGTFDPANPIEIRANAILALGGIGFNVPSLLGVAYHAPYFHSGAAQTLEETFPLHALGGGTISSQLNASQQADLLEFLKTIDGATLPFVSDTDLFRDAIGN